MKRSLRILFVFLASLLLAAGLAGCKKLAARDKLNKGVQAYKNSQFDEAIELFKQAKADDPSLLNAQLYLATAYASMYIPGAPSEENVRNGEQAVAEFQEVLRVAPNNLSAIDGIGGILYGMKKFDESKQYHKKHIQLKPDDPEPYYWVGVIDWALAYQTNGKLRNDYNANARRQIKETDPLPERVRAELTNKNAAIVEEGIAALDKATKLKKDYDDAMTYLNLLYRQKADMVASPQEREDYLNRANTLLEQVKVIRQKRLEQQAGGQPSQ
jgi:tetratricopeptide (TPR) repeat protein